jgi:predicted metal-dependent HD superfamily phosphohydrolase
MSAIPLTPVSSPDPVIAADFRHWTETWAGVGVEPAPREAFDRLLARYDERHRAYHKREHLEACFSLLAGVHDLCERPHEVALALWFHDVVYQPRRSDNEALSAGWLVDVARAAGVSEPAAGRMHSLVMATRHDARTLQGDAAVLVDIDLAILGSPVARFDQYEAQIRREYRWVPGPIYRAGRARVLRTFLERPVIYATAPFRDRFEADARANIERSLAALESR